MSNKNITSAEFLPRLDTIVEKKDLNNQNTNYSSKKELTNPAYMT